MNFYLLSIIFLLVFGFEQLSCTKFNEKLLTSGTLTNAQMKKLCGISAFPQPRIMGGRNAEPGEWPWMARISIKFVEDPRDCGGAIINYRWILTAAHCLYFDAYYEEIPESTNITVILGLLNTNFKKNVHVKTYEAKKWIIHEDFDGSDDDELNDIALIQLKKKIQFSQWIAPVCLPESYDLDHSNYLKLAAVVIGWGRRKYDGKLSPILQQVTLRVFPLSKCTHDYKSLEGYQICAGVAGGGKDACQGDSGGPLMVRNKNHQESIIGIVSNGRGCGSFGFYTRVASYLPWIYSRMT